MITTTNTATATTVEAPGVYAIPEDEYHGEAIDARTLSCSGARRLLDCPAKFHYDRTHPEVYKREFEFGHAAHTLVLGVGAPVDVLEFDDMRTKACKEAFDESRTYGRTPILAKDWAIVEAMAAEIRRHPLASALLNPERGAAEQSLFWSDPSSGLMLRARLDWLPSPVDGRRFICSDYKTARSSEVGAFARSCADYGYHQQDAWYLDGVTHLLGVHNPAFVFIVQEKSPPYVVNVIELDEEARRIGAERNRRAIDLFLECSAADRWPGYSDQVQVATLPRWVVFNHDEEFGNAAF